MPDAMNDTMNDVVIIGGGISGLYILDELTSKYSNLNIKLLERDPHVGGRIHTKYYKDGSVKFETGPWRFHHSHKNLIALLRKYNLSYFQNSSSDVSAKNSESYTCKYGDKHTQNGNGNGNGNGNANFKQSTQTSGLSIRDTSLLNNTCSSKKYESISKIPLVMDSTSKPYDVKNYYKGDYFVVEKGFSQLVAQMNAKLQQFIFCNSFVIDVIRKYNHYIITYRRRNGNQYTTYSVKTRFLFLCIPPDFCKEWTIVSKYLLPLIHSVDTIPLHHVYGFSNKLNTLFDNKFYIKTDTELGQVISGDFDNNWFQASYSSGEDAKFLYRLKQTNPSLFVSTIKKKLALLNIKIPITKFESFFWEHAIHFWKPAFQFDLDKSMRKSVYPHPVNLPNLFYAGEAFSDLQGWIEGALSTSIIALSTFDAVRNNRFVFKHVKLNTNEYVILDNRYLDVKRWKLVHPGSTAAIKNHLTEDISDLFRQINHTHYSWAVVNSIQTYWLYHNKTGVFVISN